jgi:hypothetical protein
MAPRNALPPPDPEGLVIAALGFISADEERLGRFLALTGLDPGTIRGSIGEPGFHAAVLDYVCADEELLVALASELDLAPEAIATAWRSLSGGDGGEFG